MHSLEAVESELLTKHSLGDIRPHCGNYNELSWLSKMCPVALSALYSPSSVKPKWPIVNSQDNFLLMWFCIPRFLLLPHFDPSPISILLDGLNPHLTWSQSCSPCHSYLSSLESSYDTYIFPESCSIDLTAICFPYVKYDVFVFFCYNI